MAAPKGQVIRSAAADLLGRNIERIRIEKGIPTKAKLAELTGLTTNTVSNIERGVVDASYSSLKKISEVLGVTIDELGRAPEEKKAEKPKLSVLHTKTSGFVMPEGFESLSDAAKAMIIANVQAMVDNALKLEALKGA